MPKLRIDQYISIIFLCASFLVFPTLHQITRTVTQSFTPLPPLITHLIIPTYTGTPSAQLALNVQLSATAVYVMDRQSAAILYQKNADLSHYPASTTKMMTALVARQLYPLEKPITVKEEAFALGSTAHFQVGETLHVHDLLYALLVPSGNDAAFVFANNHPAGYAGFVTVMNQRARELHLTHTVFRNPSGLDAPQQATTARDLAILANEVMKDPVLREIVGTRQTTIYDVSGTISHQLQTTQELLGTVDGVVGIKTGTTEFAGENLITEVDRDGHQVIIVMLGSKDRFAETRQVIDWVFANYQWRLEGN